MLVCSRIQGYLDRQIDRHLKTKDYVICACEDVVYADYIWSPTQNENLCKYAQLQECPACGAAKGCPGSSTFRYIPLAQQLQGLFLNPLTRSVVELNRKYSKRRHPRVCDNIFQSQMWGEKVEGDTLFFDELRNICISLCSDGANPFAQRNAYSTTPIVIRVLNFPESLGKKRERLICVGFVDKAGTLPACLDLVVDELVKLYADGAQCLDPSADKSKGQLPVFFMRVKLLMIIGDYPGLSKMLGFAGHVAKYGCIRCTQSGESLCGRQRHSDYRRWLPPDHELRNDARWPAPERRTPPPMRTKIDLIRQQRDLQLVSSEADRKKFVTATGVNGRCPFLRLSYFDPARSAPSETMHIFATFLRQHMLPTLKGSRKVSLPVEPTESKVLKEKQKEIAILNVRPLFREDYEVKSKRKKKLEKLKKSVKKLKAAAKKAQKKYDKAKARIEEIRLRYWWLTLTEENRDTIDDRFRTAPLPSGLCSRRKTPFEHTGSLNAYDLQVLFSACSKMLFHGVFADSADYRAICALSDIMRSVLVHSVDERYVAEELKVRVAEMLSELELCLPATEHAILLHLVVHICDDMLYFGPVREYSMFMYERFMSVVSQWAKSRSNVEACLTKRYVRSKLFDYLDDDVRISLQSVFADRQHPFEGTFGVSTFSDDLKLSVDYSAGSQMHPVWKLEQPLPAAAMSQVSDLFDGSGRILHALRQCNAYTASLFAQRSVCLDSGDTVGYKATGQKLLSLIKPGTPIRGFKLATCLRKRFSSYVYRLRQVSRLAKNVDYNACASLRDYATQPPLVVQAAFRIHSFFSVDVGDDTVLLAAVQFYDTYAPQQAVEPNPSMARIILASSDGSLTNSEPMGYHMIQTAKVDDAEIYCVPVQRLERVIISRIHGAQPWSDWEQYFYCIKADQLYETNAEFLDTEPF